METLQFVPNHMDGWGLGQAPGMCFCNRMHSLFQESDTSPVSQQDTAEMFFSVDSELIDLPLSCVSSGGEKPIFFISTFLLVTELVDEKFEQFTWTVMRIQ